MNQINSRIIRVVGMLPVVIFGYVTLRYSVDTPWFDDFDPFPDFLRSWILSDGFFEKIQLLLQPNNEHRMVFGKAAAALYYAMTGSLDFTFLHIVGILFTFGSLFIIRSAFLTTGLPAYLFLPVPFLLFQLQYYLISLWAICGLQHQPVVFFVCLSMFLLARGQLGWAILAGFCANFAMSNGIFVWVGGGAILLFQSRYRSLALWCVSGAAAIMLYFSGMSAQGNESSIGFFLQNPHLSFLGFFAFLGGLFDFAPDRIIQVRTALPIVMAMLVMVWVVVWLLNFLIPWLRNTFHKSRAVPVWLTRYQIRPGHEVLGYFCLGVLFFLLSNAGVIGLLRPRFGFFVMVVSNYKIYPALFLSISYLSLLSSSDAVFRMRGFRIGLVVSIVIWGLTFIHYGPTISERRKYLLVNAYNQEHHAFGLGHEPGSPAAVYIDTLMHFMTDRGIYRYPTEFDPMFEQMKAVQAPLPGSRRFELVQRPEGLVITEPTEEIQGGYNTGAFAFLRGGGGMYVFKFNQSQYTGRNLLIRYDKGISTVVPQRAVPAGSYEWGVVIKGKTTTDTGLVGTITIP